MRELQWRLLVAGSLGGGRRLRAGGRVRGAACMEAKPGEASAAPAPASAPPPMAAAAVAVPVTAAAPEATVSFQQPAAAAAERGSSSAVLVPPLATAAAVAGGGGAMALGPVMMKVPKKRGRPRKYGPDGSLIRPLNATPISASAPMPTSVAPGQYTPASAVGAAMKRGRGRPLDFAGAAAAAKQQQQHHHHQLQHQQQQQQFGFHFSSIGRSTPKSLACIHFPSVFFPPPRYID